jgi:uncharacterized membrane protein SpoIIM required for sporulation
VKQEDFTARFEPNWRALEAWLNGPRALLDDRDIPHLYRQVCAQLALARERGYSLALQDRLNGLVLRAHQRLHGSRARLQSAWLRYVRFDFPRLIRREWRLVLLSSLLLYGPYAAMSLWVRHRPEAAYLVMDPSQLARFEDMYGPQHDRIGPEREADTDVAMFGFYVRNNIGLDFRCFAWGIFLGLGTMLFLVFNGLTFGTVEAHLVNAGLARTFYGFVAGHSALELTGAVFAGVAGMKLGFALLAPGRRTRLEALKEAAQVSVRILYGTAAMTLMAAFVEAFWSSNATLPFPLKIGFGLFMALVVAGYFVFMGRSSRPGGLHEG